MPPEQSTSLKISLDQVRNAIDRSGYLLEYRLEQVLRKRPYHVSANQMYPDPLTGKSRELDLFAIGAKNAGPGTRDFLFSLLFIECANNPQPIAFFTKTESADHAVSAYAIKLSGIPLKVREKRVRRIEWERLAIFLKMERYHHYCRGRVATQFCSFTPKKSSNNTEWMASHDERHFGSFDKLCSAATHTIKDHYASAHLKGKESVNIQIYYPILVVSGELLDVRQMRKGLTIVPANHIHFIQSYIVDGQERQYHVDVVTERYFPRLLRKIEEEAATTARIMRRRARILRESIDSITASVRGLRSPEAIRARLELPNFS